MLLDRLKEHRIDTSSKPDQGARRGAPAAERFVGWTGERRIDQDVNVAHSNPWRLVPGVPAPRQQSPVTCGSACLVVARLLLEPPLARWLLDTDQADIDAGGDAATGGDPVSNTDAAADAGAGADAKADPIAVGFADSAARMTQAQRFADLERATMARTNSVTGAQASMQLPWPRSLGTPPWGALAELQRTGCLPGTQYETVLLRWKSPYALIVAARRLAARVGPGRPALLYVGSPGLPRHVALVFVNQDNPQPLVYEPARGDVFALERLRLGRPDFRLAGWPAPWLLIQPKAQVLADAPVGARRARQAPAVLSGASLRQGTGLGGGAHLCQSESTTSRTSSASPSTYSS